MTEYMCEVTTALPHTRSHCWVSTSERNGMRTRKRPEDTINVFGQTNAKITDTDMTTHVCVAVWENVIPCMKLVESEKCAISVNAAGRPEPAEQPRKIVSLWQMMHKQAIIMK